MTATLSMTWCGAKNGESCLAPESMKNVWDNLNELYSTHENYSNPDDGDQCDEHTFIPIGKLFAVNIYYRE